MRRLAIGLELVAGVLGGVVLIHPPFRAFRVTSRILHANPRASMFGPSFHGAGHVPGPGLERGLRFIFAGSEDRPSAAGLSLTTEPLPP